MDDDANNVSRESGAFKSLTRDVQNWRTPTVSDAESPGATIHYNPRGTDSVSAQTKALATPRFEDSQCAGSRIERGVNDTLYSQTRAWSDVWPTPSAGSDNSIRGHGQDPEKRRAQGHQVMTHDAVSQFAKPNESLNPDWEEILMGWPIGWTDPRKPCGTFPGFPMGQGYEQFDYEPPRTLPRSQMTGRTARIKMIGNGVVPQCAEAAFVRLMEELLGA